MNLAALLEHTFEPKTVTYTDRDTILYALSLGAGSDLSDPEELRLVYEKNLQSLPSMSSVLAHPGAWMAADKFGINMVKLLHGEQRTQFHRTLPPSGTLLGEYRIEAIVDKGADKGALMYFAKDLYDENREILYCSVLSCYFLRGDGGCGNFGNQPIALPKPPEGPADLISEETIDSRAALFYRLNGDRNPIHVDPEIAAKAGFNTPLLHGLCTYGTCGLVLLRKALNYNSQRMTSLDLRFSAPIFPGETLSIESWHRSDHIAFSARAKERNVRVISDGHIGLAHH